jgi:pimeloyl-ACP methyl ester carboxylesterase
VLTALVLVGAGCGTASSGPTSVAAAADPSQHGLPSGPPPRAVAWSACASDPALQCGTVPVPIDYRHPTGPMLEIAVTRAPALGSDRSGTLVVNPGGPGESGNQVLPVVLGLLPAAVRRSFDVVSFDPRGTGSSDRLQCGTRPQALTSAVPLPSASGRPLPGTAAFTALARRCATRAPGVVPFLDSTETARDMDRMRQALGVDRISFYGLSYGTVLGTAYAALFPSRVAAMILDGAVDVDASLADQAVEQAPAAEQSLEHLLAACSAQPGCPLGTDPRTTFTSLATSLSHHPLPAPGTGDPYPVTVGDLDTAALLAVSLPLATISFEAAVAQAARGNGGPLRTVALDAVTDLDGSPLVDPLWAITCNDAAQHPGPVAAGALARSLARRFPLLGAYVVTYSLGGCVSWPPAQRPVVDVHPSGTPVLVIGNTGDPTTPHIGAVHLARDFRSGRLLTWRGWGHTWLLSGSGDACVQRLVSAYLIGASLPRPGTVCS